MGENHSIEAPHGGEPVKTLEPGAKPRAQAGTGEPAERAETEDQAAEAEAHPS